MRSIGWVVIFCILVGLATAAPLLAGHAASVESATVVDGRIRSFGALSAQEAWVLTDETLLRTRNGGTTWGVAAPPAMALQRPAGAMFIDADTGWLVAADDTPGMVTWAATVDGGQRWQMYKQQLFAANEPAGRASAVSMHWLDRTTGWLAVRQLTSSNFSLGTLFATQDGGVTWQRRTLPGGGQVYFLSTTTGWTTGGPNDDTLYRTDDGGRTWTAESLPYIDDAAPGGRRHALPDFTADGRHGVITVVTTTPMSSRVARYATHDGGGHWIFVAEMAAVELGAPAETVDAGAWLVRSTGLSLRLPRLPSPVYRQAVGAESNAPSHVLMVTPRAGWARAAAGGVLRTLDGGQSWRPVLVERSAQPQLPAFIERAAPGTAGGSAAPMSRTARLRGPGMDMCELAGEEDMRRWMDAGPYRAVNLYIGGALRFCANASLTAQRLEGLTLQGWTFIPTWVGPQAPCTKYTSRFDADPTTAFTQGRAEAEQALQVAQALGLTDAQGAGTVIYYDLEAYDGQDNACVEAARAFVAGWTQRIQQSGSDAGLYALACNPPLSRYADLSPAPDAVWFAAWTRPAYDPAVTVNDLPASCLPPTLWNQSQRIRQYTGSHDETWGGVTLEIDSNVLDGIVADLTGVVEAPVAVIVETPQLAPAYDADEPCTSGWHRYTNVRGQPAYLSPAQALGSTIPPLNYALWQPTLPVTGTWRIEALIPAHGTVVWPCRNQTLSADTRSARYIIYALDGVVASVQDQFPLNDDWLQLGSFQLGAGDGGQVYLDAAVTDAPVHVSFSAMRFTLESEGMLPERLYLPLVGR